MKLKKIYTFIVFLFLFIPCFFAAAQSNDAAIQAAFSKAGLPLLKGKKDITDFNLPLLNGSSVRLSSLRGKVVFLNFWATWCPPCRSEMPSMEKLYQRYKNNGLEFIAVDIMEDKSDVAGFVKDFKLTFPVAIDRDGHVSNDYGISAIPTTFIIDRNGKIIASVTGSRNWDSPAIIAAFEVLLKNE
jgi:thiol-disulfide isomerase/thioredoxin